MSRYNIGFNKDDEQKAFEKLKELERDLGFEFDWKRLKRASDLSLHVTINIYERMKARRDETLEKLNAYEVDVYQDDSPSNAFYDDGFVHVVRNGWRYAVTVQETINDKVIDALVKRIVKIIDA